MDLDVGDWWKGGEGWVEDPFAREPTPRLQRYLKRREKPLTLDPGKKRVVGCWKSTQCEITGKINSMPAPHVPQVKQWSEKYYSADAYWGTVLTPQLPFSDGGREGGGGPVQEPYSNWPVSSEEEWRLKERENPVIVAARATKRREQCAAQAEAKKNRKSPCLREQPSTWAYHPLPGCTDGIVTGGGDVLLNFNHGVSH